MTQPVVILGCGGQGREIAAITLRAYTPEGSRASVLGFIDDSPTTENIQRLQNHGHHLLGDSRALRTLPRDTRFIVGIADGSSRERMSTAAEDCGLEPVTLVHLDATVGTGCHLGLGTVLWPGARLTTDVTLGRHVHVNQNVTVGHDTVANDFVTINPSAAISGSVNLGRRCLIGAGSVVLQERAVGDDSTVGASACVVKDVPARAVVKGVPAI